MNVTRYLPEEELIQKGLHALMKALGPVETRRFLRLPRSQRLESVEQHRQWQATLNQEEFFDEVFAASPASKE